ncbi:MAG: O-antigen ligase family protein [bacterium]|nr:O-antigen ligase family protein [bacterium]
MKLKIFSFQQINWSDKEFLSACIIALSIMASLAVGLMILQLPLRNSLLIVMGICGCIIIFIKPVSGLLIGILFYYFFGSGIQYVTGTWNLRIIFWITLATGISWLLYMMVQKRYRFVKCPQNFALLGLLISMYYSTFYAGDTVACLEFCHGIGKMLIFYLLLINLIESFRFFNLTYWAIGLGGGGLSLLGIKYSIGTGMSRVELGGGTQLGGSNELAGMLIMILPFFFYKIFSHKILEKSMALSFFFSTLFCIILTGSRGGTLGLLVVLILFCIRTQQRLKSLTILGIIVILCIIFTPATYWERMSTINEYQADGSAMSRIELWKFALNIWKSHPFEGIGQENFRLISPGRLVVHNTYLTLLVEGGLQALFFYLLAIFLSFRDIRFIIRHSPQEFEGLHIHNLASSLGIGLSGFLVSALFGSKVALEPLYWFLGLIVALKQIVKTNKNLIKSGTSALI